MARLTNGQPFLDAGLFYTFTSIRSKSILLDVLWTKVYFCIYVLI